MGELNPDFHNKGAREGDLLPATITGS